MILFGYRRDFWYVTFTCCSAVYGVLSTRVLNVKPHSVLFYISCRLSAVFSVLFMILIIKYHSHETYSDSNKVVILSRRWLVTLNAARLTLIRNFYLLCKLLYPVWLVCWPSQISVLVKWKVYLLVTILKLTHIDDIIFALM